MNNLDRRRFNAPNNSLPIKFNSTNEEEITSNDLKNRLDGRINQTAARPIFIKTGLVTQASGSTYIETGKTKLICSVFGPKPTPPSVPFNAKARLNVEVKLAPFSSGLRRFAPGKETEASTLSSALYQSLLPSLILDSLPKSQIDLFVTILESDGSENDISAGVTAASVALATAGVQMYGLVVGSSVAFQSSTSSFLLDPTLSESQSPLTTGFAHLACMPALGTITNIASYGVIPVDQFEKGIQACFEAGGGIHTVAKAALIQSLQEEEDVDE